MTTIETVTEAANEVLGALGEGYKEGVYEEALAHELRLRQIPYERQRSFEMLYKGYRVGEGIVDFIINPLWAGQGGKELILELKAVKSVTKDHQRQAQVYMLSLNIDEGVVMSFGDSLTVVEVQKPTASRDSAIAQCASTACPFSLGVLEESAKESFGYLGREFLYRPDTKELFPTALGVELRLRGVVFAEQSRAVLYKGHKVTDHKFEFSFADGSVATMAFYKKADDIDKASTELGSYKAMFGLSAAYLIALPEKDEDEVRVVSV